MSLEVTLINVPGGRDARGSGTRIPHGTGGESVAPKGEVTGANIGEVTEASEAELLQAKSDSCLFYSLLEENLAQGK